MCSTLLTALVRHLQHFIFSHNQSEASKNTFVQVFLTFSQINDSPYQASIHYYFSICYWKKAFIATNFFKSTKSDEIMNHYLILQPILKFLFL